MAPSTEGRSDEATPALLQVGRVARAHGLGGEVVVELFADRADRADRVAPGAVLETVEGEQLRVTASRPHQGRFLVRFEGVGDRSAAEALHGTVLQAPPIGEPDTLWVHELLGAEVLLVDGTNLGVVAAVEANPASDLLVLEGGGLVPLVFVRRHRPGQITVDIPDGLLDL